MVLLYHIQVNNERSKDWSNKKKTLFIRCIKRPITTIEEIHETVQLLNQWLGKTQNGVTRNASLRLRSTSVWFSLFEGRRFFFHYLPVWSFTTYLCHLAMFIHAVPSCAYMYIARIDMEKRIFQLFELPFVVLYVVRFSSSGLFSLLFFHVLVSHDHVSKYYLYWINYDFSEYM